jgi:hypothetical protein
MGINISLPGFYLTPGKEYTVFVYLIHFSGLLFSRLLIFLFFCNFLLRHFINYIDLNLL